MKRKLDKIVGLAAAISVASIGLVGCTSTQAALESAKATELAAQETANSVDEATEIAEANVSEDDNAPLTRSLSFVDGNAEAKNAAEQAIATVDKEIKPVYIATNHRSSKEEINRLISKYANKYGVPERLVHHVAHRESTYNPRAYHNGNYGLMQIRYNTAKGMGYTGKPNGLFDAETNLKYAVKYLRNAWIVADKNEKQADWLYRTGYYYVAKRKGYLSKLY